MSASERRKGAAGELEVVNFVDRDPMSLVDQLRYWQLALSSVAPAPWVIYTHHSVPYGRLFRQYDTRGRLVVWVNPGALHDSVRASRRGRGAPIYGIPVVRA